MSGYYYEGGSAFLVPGVLGVGGGAAAPLTYAQTVLLDSPVGYWKCTDGAGTSIADFSGNGLTLTTHNNPTLGSVAGPGTSEKALDLTSASSQYADIADNNLLDLGDTFTLEAWMYTGSGNEQYAFDKGDGAYALWISSRFGKLQNSNSSTIVTATASFAGNTWAHIVATKSGSTVFIYKNGVDVTGTVTNATCGNTTDSLWVGRTFDGTRYWSGRLAHLALYPTALSAARVAAHYTAMV